MTRHPCLVLCMSLLFLTGFGAAQSPAQPARCGFDQSMQALMQAHPARYSRLMATQQAAWEQFLQGQSGTQRNSCQVLRIPVVVHVVYDDEQSNISQAQIESQLAILNEDYRRLVNTPGEGQGVDTRLQFCLATRDPNGNPSTGITRTASAFSQHRSNESSQLKGLISWPDSQYLNFWVVNTVTFIDPSGNNPPEEILAYASFPGSFSSEPDGVVIAGKYFGSTGTATAPYNQGRTCTHEVGHYFGLLHPFEVEGFCQGQSAVNCHQQGDLICDTPAEKDPNYDCPFVVSNSCIDQPCDQPNQPANYMNYTADACMNHFTAGQAQRMAFFLQGARSSLHQISNLQATGCDNAPILLNPPKAAFALDPPVACPNQTLQMQDLSQGCVDQWHWEFPGGMPGSSQLADPQVSYGQAGQYLIRLISSNASGADTMERIIRVQAPTEAVLEESFEPFLFPPSQWQLADEDQLGSWIRTDLAAYAGTYSAALLNYGFISCNSEESLYLPPLNLSTWQSAQLSFYYAYQAHSVARSDRLWVEIANGCDGPFQPLFDKAGIALATLPGTKTDAPFVPASPSDWVQVALPLNAFVGQNRVRIRFRALGQNGQNIFLDQVQLSGTIGLESGPEGPAWQLLQQGEEWILEGTPLPTPMEVRIWDLQGRVLYKQTLPPLVSEIRLRSIRHWPTGVYFLEAQSQELRFHRKFIRP